MERQLFDRPMHELREAFVLARLAEPNMFGRPDVLEWLADPEWIGVIDLDKMPAITRQFEKSWEGIGLADELRRFATPDTVIPEWMHDRVDNWTAYVAILEGILAGRGKIYFPFPNDKSRFPVVVIRGMAFRIVHGASIVGLQAATIRDVLEIVNAGIKKFDPARTAAMSFFNRVARQAVANARASAEHDFDEAVAVSADGTKIVKAKWVLVMPPKIDGTWLLYPGSAFAGNAIRRQPDLEGSRLYGYQSHSMRAGALLSLSDSSLQEHSRVGSEFMHSLLYRLRGHRDLHNGQPQWCLKTTDVAGVPSAGSILFVQTNDCPSPLPEGGREIKP